MGKKEKESSGSYQIEWFDVDCHVFNLIIELPVKTYSAKVSWGIESDSHADARYE
jgi:hypothetical protein